MKCSVCGNEYDACFRVTTDDDTYVFDCFECAIHALAPTCAHCGCRIIGHGVDGDGEVFCCDHCLRMARDQAVEDDDEAIDLEWDDEADDEIVDEDEDEDDVKPARAPRR